MEIPTLIVDGVNYGEPTSLFVVVWSGPVDGNSFQTLEAAQNEIGLRKILQDPNAFQPRIFKLNDEKMEWISA